MQNHASDIQEVISRHPDKVPVVLIDRLHIMKSTRYITPRDQQVSEFLFHVRKRTTLRENEALFLFVNNTIPLASQTMGSLYDKYKGVDLMLTMRVEKENSFGSY
ncbi:Ubiquitin-like protein [Brazilian cedratvirus IHUMI]|uniref:Ubiquitin-like protein n=1 Tax=Brazilian cedratvirus IHUMI TaxID=2126980 RepID=A0A2R8FE58_9VIRU|nr:Ubiquitin-like protein [Brazilian cedratvirus IHUMI]